MAVTEANIALLDGNLRKGRQMIPTLQFCRKLAHEMMYNNIGMDTVDYGRTKRSSCTILIFPCRLMMVKNNEGSYDKK